MRTLITMILLLALAGSGLAEQDAVDLPDLGAAIERYQARDSGPELTPDERRVMQQANEQIASRLPDPGLEVGERAPRFTLPNAFGKPVSLDEQLESGPVVLTFYRGAWCPYCNLELRALHASMPQFQRYDASLIAVTPQKPSRSRKQLAQDPYAFQVLSDLDSKVMKAYELYFEVPEALSQLYKRRFGLDLAEYNGQDRYELPVPGTFVIDRQGTIRAAFAQVDYKRRMEPEAIVDALRAIDANQ